MGLRRPGLLTGHVTGRHGTFFDRPKRLSGDAVEDEKKTLLGRLRHGIDELAVVTNRDQLWSGVVVVVPQIVVHHLKMPKAFSGARIQREQAVSEEVAADAIGAVIIVGGRSGGEVSDASLFVHRDFTPCVRAARIRPRVFRPRVVTLFPGMRNGVEAPDHLAGPHVATTCRPRLLTIRA